MDCRVIRVCLVVSAITVTMWSVSCSSASPDVDSPQDVLDGRSWVVADMEGFPAGNLVQGELKFSSNDLHILDGVNDTRWEIAWTESGFVAAGGGEGTAAGVEGDQRPFITTLMSDGGKVAVTVDGENRPILKRGELRVTLGRGPTS